MPAPKPPITATVQAQRDFSLGQLDASIKRADDNPLMRKGLRQAVNARILNTGAVQNRPGRTLRQVVTGGNAGMRAEEIVMAPGSTFRLVFTAGVLAVYDATGTQVFTQSGMPWTATSVGAIVFDRLLLDIYITFPGSAPKVLTWDGVSTWSIATFAFYVTGGGQVRTPFYRLSPKGITMQPSATTGNITLTFSSAVLVAGHVGTRMRFCGRQLSITQVNSSVSANASVIEPLPPGQILNVTAAPNTGGATDPRTVFNIGDIIEGGSSGARGLICFMSATTVTVQILPPDLAGTTTPVTGGGSAVTSGSVFGGFAPGEEIASPSGTMVITNIGTDIATIAPQPVVVWDDEVINSFRGWPQSVTVDQFRLIFSNIPAFPRAIAWSAINAPTDFYVGALPDNAFFEPIPDPVQVQFVLKGPEGAEFVFCDRAIYYIPINETNPLKPGSVAFNLLSGSGSVAFVQPRLAEDTIVFARSAKSIGAIVATGAYKRPFEMRPLSDLHAALINNPAAIAIQTSDATFEERYLYVLNGGGDIAVGKYVTENGQIKLPIGWVPWNGAGSVRWIAALGSEILCSTAYPGAPLYGAIETVDDSQFLDAALPVNAAPAALKPPAGKGPLWFMSVGSSVNLIDLGTRMMGAYLVDVNGNLVPQRTGGENLLSAQLVAGQPWTGTIEPFIHGVQPEGGGLTRMFRRRVRRAQIYVAQSTGFVFADLYSGTAGPDLPAQGTIMRTRRVPAWNEDEDATQPPIEREQSYEFKTLGRTHNPRRAIIKDTPGPLQLQEVGFEVTT